MHEASIAEALVEQVRKWLPDDAELRRVFVDIGRLEHVEASPLRMHWTALTQGSALAEAELVIEHVPLVVQCEACGHEHEPEEPAYLVCPRCSAARILRGTGVILRRLEADQPETEGEDHGHPGRRERTEAQ